MNDNTKISIIIPVYNVASYLERCLDSIVNQTYNNLEIICVNDGSTDGSAKILDEYKKIDSRIIVINIANSGVSNARNIGIEMVSGDYIGFIDSDDYIESDMYEILISRLLEHNADMIQCDYDNVYQDISKNRKAVCSNCQMINPSREILKLFFLNKINNSVWNKIFRSSIAKKIKFKSDVSIGEDMLWVYEYCKQASTAYITDYIGYHYYFRDTSAMNSNLSEKNFQSIEITSRLIEEKKSDTELYKLCIYRKTCTCLNILVLIIRQQRYIDRYDMIKKEILKNQRIIYTNSYVPIKDKLRILTLQISPPLFNWWYARYK